MKRLQQFSMVALTILAASTMMMAQGQGKGKGKGPARPVLWVSSEAFEDGGVIPLKNAFRGDNMSPDFEFHWMTGTEAASAPDNLQTYAVVFHDIENSTRGTTEDTLHWAAFNIPGTATGIPAGLAGGVLADGTVNGPGIGNRNGEGSYFGPGAGPGAYHHYIFEFYALDTKLDLGADATRDQLMSAMDGHVIGKAAYAGRFRTEQ